MAAQWNLHIEWPVNIAIKEYSMDLYMNIIHMNTDLLDQRRFDALFYIPR